MASMSTLGIMRCGTDMAMFRHDGVSYVKEVGPGDMTMT